MSAAQCRAPQEAAEQAAAPQAPEAQNMEAIGRLVSGVAHDFNNLLTGIVLCSDLLLAGLDKESRLRRYAQEIRSAAAHGASLIQQLSTVARPGPTQTTLLSFNDVVADLRNLLARLIGENIQLNTDLSQDLECVEMNSAQARQIVLNLALNARDAMPDGGQLRLMTRNSVVAPGADQKARSTCIEFEVRDTGIGMDAQTRPRIFEPFFTTKTPGQGTGLGLATVLSIVRQHHGTIQIESEPGKGTNVKVRLPSQEFQASRKGTQV
jgi:two-component system, cell cycle sensor histidine kinase and response regulator CckA